MTSILNFPLIQPSRALGFPQRELSEIVEKTKSVMDAADIKASGETEYLARVSLIFLFLLSSPSWGKSQPLSRLAVGIHLQTLISG
jgi:hypothetical protein